MSTELNLLRATTFPLPSVTGNLTFLDWRSLPKFINQYSLLGLSSWPLRTGARNCTKMWPSSQAINKDVIPPLLPDTTDPSFWTSKFLCSVDETKAESTVLLSLMALPLMSLALVHCLATAHSLGIHLKERLNRRNHNGVYNRYISCQLEHQPQNLRSRQSCILV